MDARVQRLCAWSGLACMALFLVGFWFIAGFVPPPSPEDSPQQVADVFRDDTTAIRVGLVMSMSGIALLGPWVAAISAEMRRIEGPHSPLAFTQLAFGALLIVEFLIPLMIWATAAFRPERAPTDTQQFNDLAWLMLVGIVSTTVIEALVIGVAILRGGGAASVFPRWAGYFNVWVAICVTPGSCVVFFHDGPLAWNGVLSFWLPLVVFTTWIITMAVLLMRNATGHSPAQEVARTPEPVIASNTGSRTE